MSNEQSSISGPGGFNARVALDKITKPTPTNADGQPIQVRPTPKEGHPGYARHHEGVPDSSVPTLGIPAASKISATLSAALNRIDRENAVNSGLETEESWNQKKLLATLAEQVARNELTNEGALLCWEAAFPNVRPEDVK